MQLKLHETIRQLRKRDNRTQEELAKELGITAQAVSRWESGSAYPDMEFIPAIANYFGVTIDRLFGYACDRDNRIEELLARVQAYGLPYKNNGPWFDECVAMLREGLAEFPGNPKLTLALAKALSEAGWRRQGEWLYYDEEGHMQHSYDPGRKNVYWTEAVKLCEGLLTEALMGETAAEATELLVMLYRNLGESARGIAAAQTMPTLRQCRELLLCAACDGTAESMYIGDALLHMASAMAEQVVYGLIADRHHYDTDMPIHKVTGVIELFGLLCDDGNYGQYHKDLTELWLYLSRLQWEKGYQNEAFASLEKAYDHAVALAEMGEGYFTSPLVCHVPVKPYPRENLPRRVRDLPEDFPVWCNPDYTAVKQEMEADPRWQAWAEKCRRYGE